ncbi:hypothetical protein HX744_02855 [Pseudonocardia sp. ICBG1122]|nr:hypothetical protein [Pseudonocardia pini]
MSPETTFDHFAPGVAEDSYPHYARLRATAPAHAHPLGVWPVSRHADVVRLQRGRHSTDERTCPTRRGWAGSSPRRSPGVLVDAALDRMAEQGRTDVVDELAFPLLFTVMSELLGDPTLQASVRAVIRELQPG